MKEPQLIFEQCLISGICQDIPEQSHMAFDFLGSIALLPIINEPNFVAFSTFTYILLDDPDNASRIKEMMPELIRTYAAGQIQARMGIPYDDYIAAGNAYDYFFQPLRDIHLHSSMNGEIKPNGNYNYVIISLSIAIFILILACINFMNLSTARSTERAREVGIRKVAGSNRGLLIRQFLLESFLITLFSLVIAVLIAELAMPGFNKLSGRNISIDYANIFTIPVLLGFTIIVGLLSGSYPAFVLSSFRPTQILKGRYANSSGGRSTRDALVLIQFTVSIFLISFTLLVFWQLRFIMNKDMGFDREKVVILEGFMPPDQRESFKQEIEKLPEVVSSSAASTDITGGYYIGFMVQVEEFGSEVITTRYIIVDDDFLRTMDIKLLEGRDFSEEFNDSMNVLVNKTAVREYNLAEPIGARLIEPVDTGGGTMLREFTIIGVTEDYHYNSLHDRLNSFVLQSTTGPNGFAQLLYIRYLADDPSILLPRLESKWNEFFPEQPFQYYFLDDYIGGLYTNDRTSGRLFSVFTLLAIIIACVGLFGLAAFTAEQKTKEIGIRKVAGASAGRIVWLLSINFNKLILISFLLSVLPALWAMKRWLNNFAFKTPIPPWIFVAAGMIALVIAFITISYHSIRLANKNPAETLHYE